MNYEFEPDGIASLSMGFSEGISADGFRKYNPIKEKSYQFAVRMVNLSKWLKKEHHEYDLASQLLRAGTSIGANVREGLYSESKKDFVHKLGISKKEASETLFWLEILKDTGYISQSQFQSLYPEAEELLKMLVAIIKTSSRTLHNS